MNHFTPLRGLAVVCLFALFGATATLAQSTINPSQPAQSAPLNSAPVRSNFTNAYNDINGLLGMHAIGTLGACQSAPLVGTDCLVNGTPDALLWYKYMGVNGYADIGTFNPTANPPTFAVALSPLDLLTNYPLTSSFSSGVATLGLNHDSNFGLNGSNALALANCNANTVIAGPSSGSAAEPGCRSLDGLDIPPIALGTVGSNGGISGTLGAGNGGTGVTTLGSGVPSALGNTVNASNGLLTYGLIGTSGGTLCLLNTACTYSGNLAISGASFGLSGNISGPGIFGTSGNRYANVAGTITDTSASGTVASVYGSLFGGNTYATSNAVTITNGYDVYFKNPVAGTDVTFANKWALGADSEQINGNVNVADGQYEYSGAQLGYNNGLAGFGTAAAQSIGTSGGTLCLLNTACTWGEAQTFPNNSLTLAELPQLNAGSFWANPTGSAANAEQVTLGSTLNWSGTTLNCTAMSATQVGCGEPDNVTIQIADGKMTAVGAATNSVDAGGATAISNGTAGDLLYDNGGKVGVASGASFFDSAFCSTVGYIIARTTGDWVCSNAIPINIAWFGAVSGADTGGRNSTALADALSACASNGGGQILVPQGQFQYGTGIVFHPAESGCSIVGLNPLGSRLIFTGTGSNIGIQIGDSTLTEVVNVNFRNVGLTASGGAENLIYIQDAQTIRFSGVLLNGCDGCATTATSLIQVTSVSSTTGGSYQIWINDGSDIENCAGECISVDPLGVGYAQAIYITDDQFSGYVQAIYSSGDTGGFVVSRDRFERDVAVSGAEAAIHVDTTNKTSITYNRFEDAGNTTSQIELGGSANGILIAGNYAALNQGSSPLTSTSIAFVSQVDSPAPNDVMLISDYVTAAGSIGAVVDLGNATNVFDNNLDCSVSTATYCFLTGSSFSTIHAGMIESAGTFSVAVSSNPVPASCDGGAPSSSWETDVSGSTLHC